MVKWLQRAQLAPALAVALFLVLALLPVYAIATGNPYYLNYTARILVMALAATGLNIALGYGGMVSLGHALYIGVGAYAAAMLAHHGIDSGWAHLGAALCAGLVLSVVIGSVCLRTGGLAFIMITLAFAQMLYFLAIGLKGYGGEDGLPMNTRSVFAGINFESDLVFYLVVLVTLAVVLWVMHRCMRSRFGMALQGSRENEARMKSLGYDTFRYRLVAYVISALICVLAGFFLANLGHFASPSFMQWTLSGELIVMVAIGGMATILGPVVGAFALLLLEGVLAHTRSLPGLPDGIISDHWQGYLGVFIVVVTLALRGGIYGRWLRRGDGA